jgi:hypothetical protein
LYYALTRSDARLFLTGSSMSGHHQIEIGCAVCHTEPYGGDAVLQSACVECHGEALKAAEDSHPKRLFTDPRNADRLAVVDARRCVACHREHRPRTTRAMGVTIAKDHCFYCHAEIAKERPSHRGFAPEGCASAGCHNYHDNRALYEDFLVKHLDEPETLPQALLPRRNWASVERQIKKQPVRALTLADRDAPRGLTVHPRIAEDWAYTGHARGGVNCTDCHAPKSGETAERVWRDRPDETACRECHREEVEGFARGKHGMRRANGLPPLRPADARQPMRAAAHEKTLGCVSCHKAHRFDTRHAAVEACLGCHDDAHSRAYRASPHGRLWEAERTGRDAPGSGVSCAACHMPREAHQREGLTVIRVQHNQNRNLRPNEKMVRSVCLNCHGLGFSLAALGSPRLVARNFAGQPSRDIRSLRMARARLIEANTRKE